MAVAHHTRSMTSPCLRKRRKVSRSPLLSFGAPARPGSPGLLRLGERRSPPAQGRSSSRDRRSPSPPRRGLVGQPVSEGLSNVGDSPSAVAPADALPGEQPPVADSGAFVADAGAAPAAGLGAVSIHSNTEPPVVPRPSVPVVVLAAVPDPAGGDVAPAFPPMLGTASPAADGDDAESIQPATPAVSGDDSGSVSSSTISDDSINGMLYIDPMTPDGRRAWICWMFVTSRYHNRQPPHFP